MNTIMFSHNDLDGVGCGILHKAAFGRFAETYYCGYHNVDEVIAKTLQNVRERSNERPMIIISDLGIKPETAQLVDAYEGDKVLLDHHKTNHWLAEKYDWAIIDEDASGTLAVFNYFDEVPRHYGEFALMVDDYDRWQHNLPKSKELNRLYYIVGIDRFEERFLSNEKVEFNETELLLLELEEETIENYTDRVEKGLSVYTTVGDKRIGIGFAERYQSEVAHELIDRLEIDAIALIDINYKKISFRSRPNFDVGSIAKRLGGGGHKNASGVEFNYGNVSDFHGSKYPLFGVFESLRDVSFNLFWKFNSEYGTIETEAMKELFAKRGFNNA